MNFMLPAIRHLISLKIVMSPWKYYGTIFSGETTPDSLEENIVARRAVSQIAKDLSHPAFGQGALAGRWLNHFQAHFGAGQNAGFAEAQDRDLSQRLNGSRISNQSS